jgi:hypothetical protein
MHSPDIRYATQEDASELARLLTVLGHPTTAEGIETSWADWLREGNSAIVAARPDRLLGVVTLHRMTVLHRAKPEPGAQG